MNISKVVNWSAVVSLAVKSVGKYAVRVTGATEDNNTWKIILDRVKELDEKTARSVRENLIQDGSIFFFDTKDDAIKFFDIFNRGEVYSSACYAALLDPDGKWLDENT